MFSQFWVVAKPYWFSEERWAARGLLFVIVAINLALVWVNVELNSWNGDFYNALQDKSFEGFKRLALEFCGWALLFIVLSVYQLYLTQMLQIRWRTWLTNSWISRWTAHKSYYKIAMFDRTTDNPDQRIAEDIREFVNDTLSLSIGLLSSVVTLVSFVGILWTLSGAIEVMGINIPGYMVWVALAYAVVGTCIAHFVGRPLVALNFDQQRFEADFRYSLIRVRDNAEAIALYTAEKAEVESMKQRYLSVVGNWWGLMKQQKRYMWFASFYGQLAIIFPMLVGAPRYFSGAIQLGGLMQISTAFGEVQKSLSWFVDAYVRVAEWRSQVQRLTGFSDAMEKVEQEKSSLLLTPMETDSPTLAIADLEMSAPDGRKLFSADQISIKAGQNTVVNGASGSGKSTLFRAFSGLWPFAKGQIKTSPADQSLYLPQKTYLPLGTLKACLTFPALPEAFSDDQVKAVLQPLGLQGFAARLDETALWHSTLSPGEQQRLAIARALLNKPKWLFLDEATSALGEEAEADIYRLIHEQLPDTTVVSIAHRRSVDQFHSQRLSVDPASASLVSEVIKGQG
jgi:vitamin B12/bleomycin/antimicrobial peptide transport system ATP-binding/permease protein